MGKRHCELFGFSISEEDCSESRNDDFSECHDCKNFNQEGDDMEMHKKSREGVKCEVCGKKAEDDKYFRFNKKRCCVCLSREIRAEKKAVEGKEPVKKERKPRKPRKAASLEPQSITPPPLHPPLARGEREGSEGKPKTIVLDFSTHPELYENVINIAGSEMRTPEMQVLYFLKNGDFNGFSKVTG